MGAADGQAVTSWFPPLEQWATVQLDTRGID